MRYFAFLFISIFLLGCSSERPDKAVLEYLKPIQISEYPIGADFEKNKALKLWNEPDSIIINMDCMEMYYGKNEIHVTEGKINQVILTDSYFSINEINVGMDYREVANSLRVNKAEIPTAELELIGSINNTKGSIFLYFKGGIVNKIIITHPTKN